MKPALYFIDFRYFVSPIKIKLDFRSVVHDKINGKIIDVIGHLKKKITNKRKAAN